jgi:heme-degrading monooxygenase HmoA
MLRFTADAGDGFHHRLEHYAERMRREMPGLTAFRFVRNQADRSKGYDWALISSFQSSAAHDAYQISPLHQELRAFMQPAVADLLVCDAEV